MLLYYDESPTLSLYVCSIPHCTGGAQGVEEGQQGHTHISQKIFNAAKNIKMAAMERPVYIIMLCFPLLLKLHCIHSKHSLPSILIDVKTCMVKRGKE